MKRSAHLWIGLFLLMIAAQSAEARRFRIIPIPGFGGGGETIDRVYAFATQHRSASDPAASDAAQPVRMNGMSSGTFGIGLIAIVIAVLALFGRKLFGGVFRRTASGEEMVGGEADGPSDGLTFDERVARRLAELKSGGGEAPGGPPAPALPPRPAFGRKTS